MKKMLGMSSLTATLLVAASCAVYQDNLYYRYDDNRWYYSKDINKGWRDYDWQKLPPGLAR